jgi:RNA-directed DNA polymerase
MRLIRYADDLVILVKGNKQDAIQVLKGLQDHIRNILRMELAEEKTGVHSLMEGFDFLGYNFRRGISLRTGKMSTIIRPSKEAEIRFRCKVKELTSISMTYQTLDERLRSLNRLIRGWGEYFRHGGFLDFSPNWTTICSFR